MEVKDVMEILEGMKLGILRRLIMLATPMHVRFISQQPMKMVFSL